MKKNMSEHIQCLEDILKEYQTLDKEKCGNDHIIKDQINLVKNYLKDAKEYAKYVTISNNSTRDIEMMFILNLATYGRPKMEESTFFQIPKKRENEEEASAYDDC
ncbi:hypothetical protein FACS189496_5430 [Bacilli bacterium]|nr:hypothetical protein FACS189496_5430 [Bacilli bacterium]